MLKKTKVLVLDVLGSVCAQYTRCTDLQITSSDLVSSSLLLSMLMSNSVQPANEHDTMIKPQGFSSQTYFFHSTGHYNECVTAHNSVPPDPTMTVDNVTQVMDKIEGNKCEELMGGGGLDIPESLLGEIQRRYSTDAEKIHAGVDYYVNCRPDPSWEELTNRLFVRKKLAAARESKSFMSTGKYCHYIT